MAVVRTDCVAVIDLFFKIIKTNKNFKYNIEEKKLSIACNLSNSFPVCLMSSRHV